MLRIAGKKSAASYIATSLPTKKRCSTACGMRRILFAGGSTSTTIGADETLNRRYGDKAMNDRNEHRRRQRGLND